MHFVFICTALLGVYSRHFENATAQVFLYVMCNIYIYALAYLSWPAVVYFKEYELEGNIEDIPDTNNVISHQEIELGNLENAKIN